MGGGARLIGKDGPRAVLARGPNSEEADIGTNVDDRRPLGQLDLRVIVVPTREDLVVDVLRRPFKGIDDRKVQITDAYLLLGYHCHLLPRNRADRSREPGSAR